jgi:predicted S18 family serine protease
LKPVDAMARKKKKTKIRYRIKLYQVKKENVVLSLIMVFLVGFILGTNLSPYSTPCEQSCEPVVQNNITENSIEMLIPAVDADGNGVVARLITTVRPGSGLVLVDVNDVLANYDTQISGRTAAKAAADYMNISLKSYDVIYSVMVNASVVEGPSAGSAMSVSILLALQNRTPKAGVMMTGTIREDGTIGQAGAIFEKASAAKHLNITTFLVPVNQSTSSEGKTKHCKLLNSIEYCEVDYSSSMDISKELNMTIIEVSNIGEALGYFLE